MEFFYSILFLFLVLYIMYAVKANFFFLIIMFVVFLYFILHLIILDPIKSTFTFIDDLLYNPWGLIILLTLALLYPFVKIIKKKLNKIKSQYNFQKIDSNSI